MSDTRTSSSWGVLLAVFIALKVAGQAYIVTWSWWWLLMPIVPCIAGLFHYFGAV